ncbi:putative nuclease HARBI1 [Ixodes scapularis]|uniref:putative nuclease HARBI1 n=1 Tax=Ixodes scapularis TaxID=6945 RepID=UPI001A9DED68|nr:putative nuclease HARBI1 [Ixodes scapularis]
MDALPRGTRLLYDVTRRKKSEHTLRILLKTKMLMTPWLLGNQESYRGVADRFGVNKGTLIFVVEQMICLWTDCAQGEVVWPTDIDGVEITLRASWRFPGVVGAVDGCHINIKAPQDDQSAFYNRHDVHSVILQACCDQDMCFSHICVGKPGRMHDGRVYAMSGLDDFLVCLPEDKHVLGDSAYPLKIFLMKPYRDDGKLTPQQVKFNNILSAAGSVIERAFGRLKGKFRRLKFLDMGRDDLIPKMVCAACMLHNFILKHPAGFDDDKDDENPRRPPRVHNDEIEPSAAQKRDVICSRL